MSAIRSSRRRWLAAAGGAALFAPWQAWAQKAAPMPRRVVVIGGALAECVYALGMEHVLVAADTTCTYPRPVLALPKVGYLRALSSEGMLSLRPDLVLMSTDAGPPEALAQLRGSGVRIAAIAEQHDARTARSKIVEVARLLGAQSAAARVLADFDAAMQTTEQQVAARRARQAPVRAAFLLGHAGMQTMVAGRDTAADAMLHYAGASNVFGDDRSGFKGYKPLTAESMGRPRGWQRPRPRATAGWWRWTRSTCLASARACPRPSSQRCDGAVPCAHTPDRIGEITRRARRLHTPHVDADNGVPRGGQQTSGCTRRLVGVCPTGIGLTRPRGLQTLPPAPTVMPAQRHAGTGFGPAPVAFAGSTILSLNVLFVASEAVPLAKTGGLGDMVGACAGALQHAGLHVTVMLPGYPAARAQLRDARVACALPDLPGGPARVLLGAMPDTGVPVLLLDTPVRCLIARATLTSMPAASPTPITAGAADRCRTGSATAVPATAPGRAAPGR
ncbi:Glycogen synthase [Ralstonia syzygii subsp. syzygii]|nr:Glycogen synthase [Ralstonia syzygii subsp. syzygii]